MPVSSRSERPKNVFQRIYKATITAPASLHGNSDSQRWTEHSRHAGRVAHGLSGQCGPYHYAQGVFRLTESVYWGVMHVIKQELLVWNSHLNITWRFKCIMSWQKIITKGALYCPLCTLISVNNRKWMVSSIHCLFSGGSSWKYRLAVIFFTIGNLYFVNEKSPQTYTESHQYMYLLWCCVWHVYRLLKHLLPYSTFSTCTDAKLTGSQTCFDCAETAVFTRVLRVTHPQLFIFLSGEKSST